MHKHGRDNFSFEVLFTETGNDARKKAEDAEQLLIELLGTLAPNGFNVSTGGTSGSAGHKRSKEVKAINTAAFKKMWADNYEGQRLAIKAGSNKPESIERKKAAAKALWQNPDFRAKQAAARGVCDSDKVKAKRTKSDAVKLMWQNPEFVEKMMKARAEGAARRKELAQANAKGAATQHQTF